MDKDAWATVAAFLEPGREPARVARTCKPLLRACSDLQIVIRHRSRNRGMFALRALARAAMEVVRATGKTVRIDNVIAFRSIDGKTIWCNRLNMPLYEGKPVFSGPIASLSSNDDFTSEYEHKHDDSAPGGVTAMDTSDGFKWLFRALPWPRPSKGPWPVAFVAR